MLFVFIVHRLIAFQQLLYRYADMHREEKLPLAMPVKGTADIFSQFLHEDNDSGFRRKCADLHHELCGINHVQYKYAVEKADDKGKR